MRRRIARISFVWGEPCQARRANPTGFAPHLGNPRYSVLKNAVAITAAVCAVLVSPALAQAPKLKDVRIRGYVTEFRSPTSFDIEDYRISRDEAFTLDFENADPDITFGLNDIRVGVELEIRGRLNEATGDLKAKSITIDL